MRIDNATIPTEIIVTQAQEDYERLSYDDKLAPRVSETPARVPERAEMHPADDGEG